MGDRIYGLIGETLKHSWSVPIHWELGCSTYSLYELTPDRLGSFLTQQTIGGLNVTIPYKKAVIPYCTRIDPLAKEIGSVNTLVTDSSGSLCGYNTDAAGFSYLARRAGISFSGATVLILGTGGTSLTTRTVAAHEGASRIVVVSRSGPVNYENVYNESETDIVVNTTPVGMYPHSGEKLLDLRRFPNLKGVLDVIYNPNRTALLAQAEEMGCPCSDGLPMLVAQAVEAERIFTGRPIPDSEVERITGLLRTQTSNIVLIGMPGSGKTTVGLALSEKTGRKAIDLDELIEAEAGMTIPEIFETEGEAGFRARETKAATEAGRESGVIIMTGGGIVTRAENYYPLHQNGILFQLDRALDLLPKNGRPLSLKTDLKEMAARRAPMYKAFRDELIDNNGTVDDTVDTIWEDYLEHTRT